MHTTETPPGKLDAIAAIRQLTVADVERRLEDLDAERAALSLLRRSLLARERAKRRTARQHGHGEGTANVAS